jgi:hypothetical protein
VNHVAVHLVKHGARRAADNKREVWGLSECEVPEGRIFAAGASERCIFVAWPASARCHIVQPFACAALTMTRSGIEFVRGCVLIGIGADNYGKARFQRERSVIDGPAETVSFRLPAELRN